MDFPHGHLIRATEYQFVLRTINLYYGRATCTTDGQFLLRTTSIVGTPVLRAKTINIWYDCIIKLMNILSGRPEWIFFSPRVINLCDGANGTPQLEAALAPKLIN